MACASNRLCIHQNLKRLIKVLRGQPGSRQSDLPLGSVQACVSCQRRCTWPLCQCPDSGVFEWTSEGVDQSNSWGCHSRSSGWPVSKKPGFHAHQCYSDLAGVKSWQSNYMVVCVHGYGCLMLLVNSNEIRVCCGVLCRMVP